MNPGDQNAAIARRAWYRAPLQRFVDGRAESILGELAANSDFSVDLTRFGFQDALFPGQEPAED
jgi:hypothetical protein